MADRLFISGQYRSALRDAACLQLVLLGLCALVLDGGELLSVCAVAVLAFWGGVGVLLYRASRGPSQLDLLLVRFGFLPVLILAGLIVPQAWRLRGVL